MTATETEAGVPGSVGVTDDMQRRAVWRAFLFAKIVEN